MKMRYLNMLIFYHTCDDLSVERSDSFIYIRCLPQNSFLSTQLINKITITNILKMPTDSPKTKIILCLDLTGFLAPCPTLVGRTGGTSKHFDSSESLCDLDDLVRDVESELSKVSPNGVAKTRIITSKPGTILEETSLEAILI